MISDSHPPASRATFVRRGIAGVIDAVICLPTGLAAGLLIFNLSGVDVSLRYFVLFVTTLGVGWLYCAGLESSALQATLGKRVAGIVVTDLQSKRLGFVAASLRYFAKTVSALPLFAGFIAAAFTARRQALHDVLASTLVARLGAVEAAAEEPIEARRTSAETPVSTGRPAFALPPLSVVSADRPSGMAGPAAASQSHPRSAPMAPESAPRSRPRSAAAVLERSEPSDGSDHTMLVDAPYAPTILVTPRLGWTVAVVSGPDTGRSYDLGWEVGIGREPDNVIRLSDNKASRHHAVIVQRPNGFVLTDLGSSNGTFVDGERIADPRLLTPGAEITIGNTQLIVRSPDGETG
jgi:uncharacterized RDD family membrane protein YckC